MKNKINILIQGGSVQSIMADSIKDVEINFFDLDNDPELESDWDEVTRNQIDIL